MSTTFSTDSQQLDGLSVGFGNARGSSVLAIASRYLGVKYRYGGTSPIGWDCAGAMMYIYRQLGVNLPRTANPGALWPSPPQHYVPPYSTVGRHD